MGSLKLHKLTPINTLGAEILDGSLNDLFPDGTLGDGVMYGFFTLANVHATATVTAGNLYVVLDLGGGGWAVAVGDASAQPMDYAYPPIDATALTFVAPTTAAAGLIVPTLGPSTKTLFCARRDLSAGTVAYPEANKIVVQATVPIGYT